MLELLVVDRPEENVGRNGLPRYPRRQKLFAAKVIPVQHCVCVCVCVCVCLCVCICEDDKCVCVRMYMRRWHLKRSVESPPYVRGLYVCVAVYSIADGALGIHICKADT